jgi:KaiC/GvpD/RAD55 family RecA-like ATPase
MDDYEVNEEAINIKRIELNSMLIGRYWTKARALLETLSRLTAPKRGGFFDGCKFTVLDLMREDPPAPRKWVGSIIDESGRPSIGMLPEGEVGLLAGSAGGGKSMLAVGLATGFASGTPALDVIDCPRGRVLYVSAEDGRDEVNRRTRKYLERQIRAEGAYSKDDIEDICSRITYLARPRDQDWSLVDLAGRPTAAYDALLEEVTNSDYKLVILDTLSRLGNDEIEKSPTASRRYVEMLERLCMVESKPCILVLHHVRKNDSSKRKKNDDDDDDDDDLTADDIRGTSGLVGSVRFAVAVTPKPKSGSVRIAIAKSNYGPRGGVTVVKAADGVIWGRKR